MAVTVSAGKNYGYSLLPLFDVNKDIITEAAGLGIEIVQSTPGNFLVKASDGHVCGTVPIKGKAISYAKAGGLGVSSKNAIKYQFESALSNAVKHSKGMGLAPEVTLGQVKPEPPKSDAGIATAYMAAAAQELANDIKAKYEAAKPYNVEVVDLPDADTLYQAVNGTSAGSVYEVAAIMEGFNIAVRRTTSKMSVRCAGPSVQKYNAQLTAVGMTLKDAYYSAHYTIPSSDEALAKKTFGAIIGAVGFSHLLKGGDVTKIKPHKKA